MVIYNTGDIMPDKGEQEKHNKELETLEFEQIIEDIKEYVTEKDGLEAMTMWVKIQKRINAFRKKKVQGF